MKHRNTCSPQNTKNIQIHLNSCGERKWQNYHKINRNTHKTNMEYVWNIVSLLSAYSEEVLQQAEFSIPKNSSIVYNLNTYEL